MREISVYAFPRERPELRPFRVHVSLDRGNPVFLPECETFYRHPAVDFAARVYATDRDDVRAVLAYHWPDRLRGYVVHEEEGSPA